MGDELTEAVLQKAMLNDELVLYYQPKVSLLSGDIIGAEALVRWSDGANGIVSPSEFLPLAERSGLLHDLTLQLLDQVIDASAQLPDHHQPALSLSINVAPDDLASNAISQLIGKALDEGRIVASDLQVEITESAVIGNVDKVYDDLVRLKSRGIKILMDDFGTGYSSIDRLSQLPFDALKLDQGVVKRMGSSVQNLDVVRSAISMARELGMTSVAEGIETVEVYNFLIAHGCDEAQGFFIARPMTLHDFKKFIDQDHDFGGSQLGRVHQASLNLMRFRKSLLDVAFCRRLNDGTALASLSDFSMPEQVAESRLGLWYFGIGQKLADHHQFSDIEQPLRRVHEGGLAFLDLLDDDSSSQSLDEALESIDQQVDQLLSLFHTLERFLLKHKSN
ncbi:MAG: EAL domain-containing protein [Granulosicoccus sp.]